MGGAAALSWGAAGGGELQKPPLAGRIIAAAEEAQATCAAVIQSFDQPILLSRCQNRQLAASGGRHAESPAAMGGEPIPRRAVVLRGALSGRRRSSHNITSRHLYPDTHSGGKHAPIPPSEVVQDVPSRHGQLPDPRRHPAAEGSRGPQRPPDLLQLALRPPRRGARMKRGRE